MNQYVHESLFPSMAYDLVNAFEDADCDTMEGCEFVKQYLKWNDESYRWDIK